MSQPHSIHTVSSTGQEPISLQQPLEGSTQPTQSRRSLEGGVWPDLIPVKSEVDLWNLEYIQSPLLEQLGCSVCQCVLVDPYSTKCG